MSTKTIIGYSPLTEKVYMGKANVEKGLWANGKKDITGMFINVLFDWLPTGKIRTVNEKEKKYALFNIDWNDPAEIDKLQCMCNKRIEELK